MMHRLSIAAAGVALLSAGSAVAQPVQTQADLTRMAGEDFATADRAMNVQYRATMAAMKAQDAAAARYRQPGPTYQRALLNAQRAWLAWRDAECLLAGYRLRGGSAQPMETAGCKARLTEERTAALKKLTDF